MQTRRIIVGLSALLIFGFVFVGTWSSYWAEQRQDQYQLLTVGQCVYDGGRLYVDCWENKPPGILWLNALGIALSGKGQFVAWLAPGFVALLSLALFGHALCRVFDGWTAFLSTILATVVVCLRTYDTPSINPDCYSALFELIAVSWLFLAFRATTPRRRIMLSIAAGLWWSAAATVKQTGLAGPTALVVATLATIAFQRFRQPSRTRIAFGVFAGFLFGLGVVASWLAYEGTLTPAWDAIFEFNRRSLNWGVFMGALRSWIRIQSDLKPLVLPLWLAALGGGVTLWHEMVSRKKIDATAPPYDADDVGSMPSVLFLALWWTLAVILALMGPSATPRYWQGMWPPMLWLSAMGVSYLLRVVRGGVGSSRTTATLVCVTVFVLLGRPLFQEFVYGLALSYESSCKNPTEREQYAEWGRQITAAVPENAKIFVWAYDSGLYVYSNRAPASRHTHPRSTAVMKDLLVDLEAHPPFAFLIPDHPSALFEHWCDEECQIALRSWMVEYEPHGTVGAYQIRLRTDAKREPSG